MWSEGTESLPSGLSNIEGTRSAQNFVLSDIHKTNPPAWPQRAFLPHPYPLMMELADFLPTKRKPPKERNDQSCDILEMESALSPGSICSLNLQPCSVTFCLLFLVCVCVISLLIVSSMRSGNTSWDLTAIQPQVHVSSLTVGWMKRIQTTTVKEYISHIQNSTHFSSGPVFIECPGSKEEKFWRQTSLSWFPVFKLIGLNIQVS